MIMLRKLFNKIPPLARLGFCIIAVFAALWLVAINADAHPVEKTTRQQARELVVQLLPVNKDIDMSCSAVVLEPGRLITVAHCLGVPGGWKVHLEDGTVLLAAEEMSMEKYTEEGLNDPDGADIGFISVPGLECPCVRMIPGSAMVDEEVYVVGYPYGTGSIITEGRVQGRYEYENRTYLFTTAEAGPGNSGGALFLIRDGKPYLVGILSMAPPSGAPSLSVEVGL